MSQGFVGSRHLERHLAESHGNKRYECPLADCESNKRAKPGFTRQENLNRHMTDKHAGSFVMSKNL
jgi:hypothetical protein